MIRYESLERYVRSLEGKRLFTQARRSEFTVRCKKEGWEYVPRSTGMPRPDPERSVRKVIDRYNRTQALRPGKYADISVNASYLMCLIALMTETEEGF